MRLTERDYQSLEASQADIDRLVNTLIRLIDYAALSRRHGILILEEDALREENPFLAAHLSDLCDGIDPQRLHKKMKVWSCADNLQGIDRIIRAVEIQALKDIQSGENPHRMTSDLIAYLPPQAREKLARQLAESNRRGPQSELNELYAHDKPAEYVRATIRDSAQAHRGARQQAVIASDRWVLAGVLYQAPRRFQNALIARIPYIRLDEIPFFIERMGETRMAAIHESCHMIFRNELALRTRPRG